MIQFDSNGNENITVIFPKRVSRYNVFHDGKMYHHRECDKDEKPFSTSSFNVVKSGSYTVNDATNFSRNAIKISNYNTIALPAKERDVKIDGDFYFTKNNSMKTPARIFTQTGEIQVGNSYEKYSEQVQRFIVLHEMGHMYYITEWKCDLYALLFFLKEGYNDSNAFYALEKVLRHSPQNMKRINNIYAQIQKTLL